MCLIVYLYVYLVLRALSSLLSDVKTRPVFARRFFNGVLLLFGEDNFYQIQKIYNCQKS